MSTACSISFAALLLAAAPSPAREVTFSEARAAAERLAPDVLLAERKVAVANAEIAVAGSFTNPTLTVETAKETARLGTQLSVPLPLFGQRGTAIDAARGDAQVAALEVLVARREALRGATLAWLDLWEAQERARFLELASQDAGRLLRIAREKMDAGTGARIDVVRTGADLARAAAEAKAARDLAAASSARLAPWLGAEPEAELAAAGAPGYPQLAPLASLEARLAEHPELRRDQGAISAAQRHVENEERKRWPLVSPQLTVNYADPTLPATDVIAGLSFELPVLSLNGDAIARARAQKTVAELIAAAGARKLRSELLEAYRRAEGLGAKLGALRDEVVPALQEAEAMTEEGYQSGRLDLLRVLDSQKALLESRLALAEASADWARAAADVERASGAPLEGSGHAP